MTAIATPEVSTEWQQQESELAAIRHMLELSYGKFSLSIAVCNSPRLRDQLIRDLQSQHPGLPVCAIPAGTVDVYDFVRQFVGDASPAGLFLTNLEASLPSAESFHHVLRSLNAARELLEEHFFCPVVIWLPEYAAKLLSQQAPDFWRYRSHTFEFVSARATLERGMSDPYDGNPNVLGNLNADERRFRIAELEQRLEELGDKPAPSMHVHADAWWSEIGFHHRILGNPKEAEEAFRHALDLAEQVGDKDRISSAIGNLAVVYKKTGKLDQAEALFNKSLELSRETGNKRNLAAQIGNLGEVYWKRGDLNLAESTVRQALDLYEQLDDKQGIAICLNNLGIFSKGRGELEKAEELHTRSLRIGRELGDNRLIADSLGNLGIIHMITGDLRHAESMIRDALAIGEELGNKRTIAAACSNLGEIYTKFGKLIEAEVLIQKAMALSVELNDKAGIAIQYANLATIWEKRGDLDRAKAMLQESRNSFEQAGMIPHAMFEQSKIDSLISLQKRS